MVVDKVEVSDENYCPGDLESLAKICQYHDQMGKGRNRYAQRIPLELRRNILSLEILEKRKEELKLELDENLNGPEVVKEAVGLENLFFAASYEEHYSLVSKFLIKHKFEMFSVTSRNDYHSKVAMIVLQNHFHLYITKLALVPCILMH